MPINLLFCQTQGFIGSSSAKYSDINLIAEPMGHILSNKPSVEQHQVSHQKDALKEYSGMRCQKKSLEVLSQVCLKEFLQWSISLESL